MENKFTITPLFELEYRQKSGTLHLTHVETHSGRCVSLDFDAQATRALYDLLCEAAAYSGGRLGAEVIEKPKVM